MQIVGAGNFLLLIDVSQSYPNRASSFIAANDSFCSSHTFYFLFFSLYGLFSDNVKICMRNDDARNVIKIAVDTISRLTASFPV